MNYYELKKINSLNYSELINKFNNGNTIKKGCVSVYDDSIGKPGDRLVEIESIIHENDNKLIIKFKNNEIIVFIEPEKIIVNEKVIGIQTCKKIEWILADIELKYLIDKNELKTLSMKGEHSFRVKQEAPAFLFYTW